MGRVLFFCKCATLLKMVCAFEKKVSACLVKCGINIKDKNLSLGVAVSGGADSVSLLLALKNILPFSAKIQVITVNHNLRREEETSGDASFVQNLCSSINIPCTRLDIPKNRIYELASVRKTGLEEAARAVRYEAFENFIKTTKVDALCTAHTLSDNAETLVMRFLQGSGAEGLKGIPYRRGNFIRPLLDVSRTEVESYLKALGQDYRTDSTNADTTFLRNRIRSSVVPLLDEEFPGWKNALSSLRQKMSEDDEALFSSARELFSKAVRVNGEGQSAVFDTKLFASSSGAVGRRLVYLALEELSLSQRVPFSFVQDLCTFAHLCADDRKSRRCETGLLEALIDEEKIVLQKKGRVVTESGFSAILREEESVPCGDFCFSAHCVEGGMLLCEETCKKSISLSGVSFPVCIRSPISGDSIRNADGSMRSIKGILDGWKACSKKQHVPIVQDLSKEDQPLVCIWGSLLGFENWIVR